MKNHKVPPRKVFRTLSKLSYTLGSALLIASLAFNFIPANQQNALAASVLPTVVSGNPTCKSLGYQSGLTSTGAPTSVSMWSLPRAGMPPMYINMIPLPNHLATPVSMRRTIRVENRPD